MPQMPQSGLCFLRVKFLKHEAFAECQELPAHRKQVEKDVSDPKQHSLFILPPNSGPQSFIILLKFRQKSHDWFHSLVESCMRSSTTLGTLTVEYDVLLYVVC